MSRRWKTSWIALALALSVVLVYARVAGHEFVHYDDDVYVYENPHVLQGLSWDGVRWAFTSVHAANYHPLTWISHMLDVELFGLDPGAHHLVSVGLHALNAALCFLALRALTRRTWPCAFAAALFALHPLRVESVAWIAERKDVLVGTFWMLSLLAYARYARAPSVTRYALVAVGFVLALLAKPMAVTLPFVLLLLDFWPLGRWPARASGASAPASPASLPSPAPTPDPSPAPTHPGKLPSRTSAALRGYGFLLEKLPLLLIALASALVTLAAQRMAGSTSRLDSLPLHLRVLNALAGCAAYVQKTLVPSDLSVFYPHPALSAQDPEAVLSGPALAGALLLLVGGVLAFRCRRSLPSLTLGYGWFFITLLPVIGLVQVGTQAFADRYTYIPSVGLACLLSFALEALLTRRPEFTRGIVSASCLSLGALALGTAQQVGAWRDSETLFRHALARNDHNYLAHVKLGELARLRGELDRAAQEFERALAFHPLCEDALRSLAQVELERGDLARAEEFNGRLLALAPGNLEGRLNRAAILLERGDVATARAALERILAQEPEVSDAHFNLGIAAQRENDLIEAEAHYRAALTVDPAHAGALNNLGQVLLARGQASEAAQTFERLTLVDSHDAGAQWNLGIALTALGAHPEAERAFQRARELDPSFERATAPRRADEGAK